MPDLKKSAIVFGASRIAYAAALLVAPGRAGGPWLGPAAASGGGRVAARALAVRDGALGAGLVMAAASGASIRPWAIACAISDAVDLTATVVDRESLPRRAAPATVAVAGLASAGGVALALAADQ